MIALKTIKYFIYDYCLNNVFAILHGAFYESDSIPLRSDQVKTGMRSKKMVFQKRFEGINTVFYDIYIDGFTSYNKITVIIGKGNVVFKTDISPKLWLFYQ
jgi:hypothetical protein